MDTTPLYDLSPIARLMLLGVVVALGPLIWIWMRNRDATPLRRLQALTVLTLFLTFDLVLFGAFTRLTDSGLGCPDWPGCYGKASPVGAHAEITAAQNAMPTGPVTHGKAWVEMLHRYLATGVGVLVVTIAVVSWLEWWRLRRAGARGEAAVVHPAWPLLTLFWVCLQGAFGAWTVTMKLFPAIVVAHLVGGIVLLVLLCVLAVRYTRAFNGRPQVPLRPVLRAGVWLVFALVGGQVLLGGWVSTNYAVLACTQFPQCQGSWWPAMDFRQGFELWRPLGLLRDGSNISFAALTAIHYVHRLFAYVVFVALGLLAWRLWRVAGLARAARWIAFLAFWQFATGLSNVVLGWPLVAAVSHTGGAAALVVALAWVLASSRRDAAAGLAPAPNRLSESSSSV
ncbi:heme A synthase [uncultured Xylophilus sp.]|uniref:COX15/CtaA family protein n=1 Tax=uncultured Xylophilus sp. TaxID=296832 RepID=UPI0025EAF628|nr:COX15/CtaA family protein [uncultured Xylophilus sp.]